MNNSLNSIFMLQSSVHVRHTDVYKEEWYIAPTQNWNEKRGNASGNKILTCGNKLSTRCNRGFYCRSYCLLNMFRALLCPSSGAQEYYTVVAACGHITLSSTPDQQLEKYHSTKYHRQQPLYNTPELLMMGIVVPETCWASNKICNKNLCCI